MNKLTIRKFEHAALLLEHGGHKLAIDFGSFSANSVSGIGPVDAALVSHGHPDHFDAQSLKLLCGASTVFTPADVLERAREHGLHARPYGMGQTFTAAGVLVTSVTADHGPKLSKPVENYGFVLDVAGRRLYFVGDAAVPASPPPGPFDAVAVPVGGAGYTFDPHGALNFLTLLGEVGMVIPVHYEGVSDRNSPEVFRALAGGRFDVRVLDNGEGVEL